ncbi:MAG: hypothetical protein ABI629_16950 [bacterium]
MAACLAVACDCGTLRFLWFANDVAPGQYQVGYFEEPGGVASLVFDDAQHTSVQPDVGLDAGGGLSLPPGRSIVLPLRDGVEYRVQVEDREWAPYCVVGSAAALADAGGGRAAFRLMQGRTPTGRDGALTLAPWTVVRAWRDEQRSLQALRNACAPDTPGAGLIARQRDGHVELEYGACTARLDATDGVLAVLAGPSWTSVDVSAAWRTQPSVRAGALLTVAGVALLRFATTATVVGAAAAMGLAALTLGLAAVSPSAGLTAFALLLLIGCAAAGARLLRGADGVRSVRRLGLGYLLILLPVGLAALPFVPASWLAREPAAAPARCLLLGYSSVRGDSLRQDQSRGDWAARGGMWEALQRSRACAGSLARQARAAGRFSWVRDAVCDAAPSVLPGGKAIFFGGSNDDFLWARLRAGRVAQMVRLARYAYARPSVAQWQQLAAAAEVDSLAALPEQERALREAVGCLHAQEARFDYFHDFVAWDLAAPRSDARQQMLTARAAAVRAAGGRFVDVYAELAPEVGVWWFNDYIHPSAIAHRRLGEVLAHGIGTR